MYFPTMVRGEWRMNRGRHWVIYVIGVLIAIGLLSNLRQLIIPVVVFGVIFLLWKFPPARWKRPTRVRSQASSYAKAKSTKDKRKPIPFKVIQGNKKDDKDSDPPYPYH